MQKAWVRKYCLASYTNFILMTVILQSFKTIEVRSVYNFYCMSECLATCADPVCGLFLYKTNDDPYTGCFKTCGHYCRRWFPRSLSSKKFIKTCVRFWTVTELWAFFNFCIRPRVNRFLWNQLAVDVLNLVAYHLQMLRRATRAVHNQAAACVAAGSGIFENQL